MKTQKDLSDKEDFESGIKSLEKSINNEEISIIIKYILKAKSEKEVQDCIIHLMEHINYQKTSEIVGINKIINEKIEELCRLKCWTQLTGVMRHALEKVIVIVEKDELLDRMVGDCFRLESEFEKMSLNEKQFKMGVKYKGEE